MVNAWAVQTELKQKDIPTPADIKAIINSISPERIKALIAMAYLTGGRISEIVKTKYLFKPIYHYLSDKPRIIARDKEGKPILKEVQKVQIDYPGITKKNINYTYDNQQRRIMLINMANRKNKQIKKANQDPTESPPKRTQTWLVNAIITG